MRISHKKGFTRNKSRRQFGFGRRADYAAKSALAALFGPDDHYLTRHTHAVRFRHLTQWLSELDPSVRDMRKVTVAHIEAYAKTLADQVAAKTMTIAYAQNLLSTVNIVLFGLRGDRELWLSPASAVGRRSAIRTILPEADWTRIDSAVAMAEKLRNPRGAALILLCRAFGMRLREACLANLDRLRSEADKLGSVRVLDGTKGGRKSGDRIISVGPRQQHALDYACRVRDPKSGCLVNPDEDLRTFVIRTVSPMRPILKQVGIRHFHDLRAQFLIDAYEAESGQPAPLRGTGPYDPAADHQARISGAKLAGHGRISPMVSYVGARPRVTDKSRGTDHEG